MNETLKIDLLERNENPFKKELFDLEKFTNEGVITDSIFNTIKENPFCIDMIKQIAEFDNVTLRHSFGVARYAELLSKKIGLKGETAEDLILASLLHDHAKKDKDISELVKKDGKLSEEEDEIIRMHPRIIFEELKRIGKDKIAKIVVAHHEREKVAKKEDENLKQESYPRGQFNEDDFVNERREDVPEILRVQRKLLAISDVFDALINKRPYKEEFSLTDTEKELRRQFPSKEDDGYIKLLLEGYEKENQ